MEQIHRIIKVGNSLAVVLPKKITRAMSWERGDQVIFSVVADNEVVLHKISNQELLRIKLPNINHGTGN